MRHSMMVLMLVLAALAGCDETTSPPDAAVADQKVAAEASVDQAVADAKVAKEAATPDAAPKLDQATLDKGGAPDVAAPDATLSDAAPKPDLPTGCNPSKVSFTQSNAKKYELYELCFKAGDTTTETLVKALDSTLTCKHSSGGIAAKCPSGTWRCMAPLQLNHPAKDVKTTQWMAICSMSWLPSVSKIAGGYYI